ncbi:hypothetical protein ACQJBY_059868 [Aegilops geniculata]
MSVATEIRRKHCQNNYTKKIPEILKVHAHCYIEPSGHVSTARPVRIVWPTRARCYFVGRDYFIALVHFLSIHPPPTTCRRTRPCDAAASRSFSRPRAPPPSSSCRRCSCRPDPPPGYATCRHRRPHAGMTPSEVEGDAAEPEVQT